MLIKKTLQQALFLFSKTKSYGIPFFSCEFSNKE